MIDVKRELPEGEKFLPSRQELDLAELVILSNKFKEHIPDGEFSMAALRTRHLMIPLSALTHFYYLKNLC